MHGNVQEVIASSLPEAPYDNTDSTGLELRIGFYGGDDVREPQETKVSPDPTIVVIQPVSWDGPDDPINPQNWSGLYKVFVIFICCLLCLNVTFASSAPTSLTLKIIQGLHISEELSYLITTIFILGVVVGSVVWGPSSELWGRRDILLLTMSCYTVLHIGQALAKNIATLMVTRFLNGFFAAAPTTICGGIIADVMSTAGRGYATSLFAASTFLGPVLGPVIGGFIADSSLDWPWIFWVMMIFAGACTLVTVFGLPETYAPIILARKAHRLRKLDPQENKDLRAEHENQDWSIQGVIQRTVYRPFKMLWMEPILILITIYFSVVLGLLYALFEAFPVIFIGVRGFTFSQTGLVFIGVGIGTTVGSVINMMFSMRYPTLIKRWRGFPPPEERLYGAMIGAPTLAIGSLWLGWTGQYGSIPWYVPGISTILIGTGISSIVLSFVSYLIDTYLSYSSSALAANNLIRFTVAAAFPLFTTQMYKNLGINWASTLIALIALLFTPSPFLFYRYGTKIRAKSKFAPCPDLKIAELLMEREMEKKHEIA